MALNPGTRIGAFEITGRLGSGGMGEVYRARDTSLGRDVAIKVLPEAFARDPDRLARFEREAHLLASLNHQNIGTIYGIHEGTGRYRTGTRARWCSSSSKGRRSPIGWCTARSRSTKRARSPGRLPTRSTPRTNAASSIAISSRRISKCVPTARSRCSTSGSPRRHAAAAGFDRHDTLTVTAHGTRGGIILGTPGYMSPEQARGQEVDKRTDIWAFGCVLFAMLTGRTPFDGDTLSDVIAATLTSDPDWNALPARRARADPARAAALPAARPSSPAPRHRRRARRPRRADPRLDSASAGAAAADEARSVSFQRLTDLVGVNESAGDVPRRADGGVRLTGRKDDVRSGSGCCRAARRCA